MTTTSAFSNAGLPDAAAALLAHHIQTIEMRSMRNARLDAYYERCLNPWDLAAGWLVAQEAGAVVRGADGGRPDRNLTLAGSAAAVAALSAILAG